MISKAGAVVVAASGSRAKPYEVVSSITVIENIIISLHKFGVFPIVVITGKNVHDMHDKLYSKGVIFITDSDSDLSDLLTSSKLGFDFLQGKVEKIIFCPVNFPFFSEQTLSLITNSNKDIAIPTYGDRDGHPLSFSNTILSEILSYNGTQGIRSFINEHQDKVEYIPVNDKSILYKVGNDEQLEQYLQENICQIHPYLDVKLEKEHIFFNSQTKLLLFLISNSYSMKQACEKMAISNTKAWQLINDAEKSVNFKIVQRKHGGNKGGRTKLSPQGEQLLISYQKLEEDIFSYTKNRFEDIFKTILDLNNIS